MALACAPAFAANILIVNGLSSTSETGTTNSITTNLVNLETAIGNTTTVLDTPPASLTGYDQAWDIRFSNSSPLTAANQTLYTNFLAGGHGMFVMGENVGFMTRNNSVLALIASLGGGTLTFTSPNSTQTVNPPATGPNPLSTITYQAPGGTAGAGTGIFLTSSGGSGTALAFGPGTLSGASTGTLTAIFDVNFMQTDASTNETTLLKNLINYVNVNSPNPPSQVPEPATVSLMAMGIGAFAWFRRKR